MNTPFDTIREALRLLLPDYPETAITAIDALAAIEAENKRLREALEEIADNTDDPTAEAVARTALEHKL